MLFCVFHKNCIFAFVTYISNVDLQCVIVLSISIIKQNTNLCMHAADMSTFLAPSGFVFIV